MIDEKTQIEDELIIEDICPVQKEGETRAEFLVRKWTTKMKICDAIRNTREDIVPSSNKNPSPTIIPGTPIFGILLIILFFYYFCYLIID